MIEKLNAHFGAKPEGKLLQRESKNNQNVPFCAKPEGNLLERASKSKKNIQKHVQITFLVEYHQTTLLLYIYSNITTFYKSNIPLYDYVEVQINTLISNHCNIMILKNQQN